VALGLKARGALARTTAEQCELCGGLVADDRCVECGRQATRRLTFASLLRDGVSSALGVNSRWLRTVRQLLSNAGATAAEYAAGARERYSHPIAFALASITAYVVARQLTAEDSFFAWLDPVLLLGAAWSYLAIPLLIPAAFAMRALFRSRQVRAAEAYVLILYVTAQLALVETAWTGVLYLGAPEWLTYGLRVLEALYATAAVVQFTGERRWHGWLRSLLVVAAGVGTFMGVLYAMVWYVISMFS
jgi:hypothetical protein